MQGDRIRKAGRAASLVAAVLGLSAGTAQAQSASLLGVPGVRAELTLATNSWYFLEVEPPPEIQLYDLITVVVDEKSQVISEGEMDRRVQSNMLARIQDWFRLDGFDIRPAPQFGGDPTIGVQLNSRYKAEATLETADGLRFRIASSVVDIRPNGNLVLEGHRTITNNDEVWEYSISGIVRREDVAPDNTVLSGRSKLVTDTNKAREERTTALLTGAQKARSLRSPTK